MEVPVREAGQDDEDKRKELLSGIVEMRTVVTFSIATPVAASTGLPGGEVPGT
jgi:hypothetical protein